MADLYRFAAFISYSSKDAAFAQRVHRALEAYRIPTQLGAFDLVGGGKKNRIYPIFRDREELPSGELGEQIEAALKASAALIIVCSPNAAASPWVNAEIESFLKQGRRDRIFAIIADVAPVLDEAGADATALSFPPAFRGDGLGQGFEPLAADARRGKDGFHAACLKLVAGLIGVNAGALADRDRKRRRAQAFQFTFASAALFGMIGYGAGWSDTNARRALLASAPAQAAEAAAPMDPTAFAIAAAGEPGSIAPTYNTLAKGLLERSARLPIARVLGRLADKNSLELAPDGSTIAAWTKDGAVTLYPIDPKAPARVLGQYATPEQFSGLQYARNGTVLAVWEEGEDGGQGFSIEGGKVDVFDLRTGAAPLSLGKLHSFFLSDDGGWAVVRRQDRRERIVALSGATREIPLDNRESYSGFEWAANGRAVAYMDQGNKIYLVDLAAQSPTLRFIAAVSEGAEFHLSANGVYLLTKTLEGENATIYDVRTKSPPINLGKIRSWTWSEDRNIWLIRYNTGPDELHVMQDPPVMIPIDNLQRAILTSDGSRMIAQGDNGIGVLANLRGNPIGATELGDLGDFSEWRASTSGDAVALKDDQSSIRVMRTQDPVGVTAQLKDLGNVSSMGLADGGERLLLNRRNNTSLLIEVTAKPVSHDLGHATRAIMTRDGRYLVVVDSDLVARQFDLARPIVAGGDTIALAQSVCATNGDSLTPFPASQRAGAVNRPGARSIASLLAGRPWNPCDWRGLLAIFPNPARGDGWFEGLRQWWRHVEVTRLGRQDRDYTCAETLPGATAAAKAARARLCDAYAAPPPPTD